VLALLVAASLPASAHGAEARSAEDEALIEELSRMVQVYEEESQAFRREVDEFVKHQYEKRRESLSESYDKAMSEVEVQERKERLDAIARFEEFLRRYPNEPRHTPDVMFRLAELYFERSRDDHQLATDRYKQQLEALLEGAEPPPEPKEDFSASIALYRKILGQFPDYRLNDGALYLLGYCLEIQGEPLQGLASYRELIARYPSSRLISEAWVRIGEYHFDDYEDPDALKKAAEAYEQAVLNTASAFYDKALYKLGWTYYRNDEYEKAVLRFAALLDLYEARRVEQGAKEASGDLREEAVQYIAVSLADDTWGGLERARQIFSSLGSKPWEAEIYKRLGRIWLDNTNYPNAVQALRLALEKDPLAADAPQTHQLIVRAYSDAREMDNARAETAKLAEAYGPDSAWYKAHENEPQVLASAEGLVERSLYDTATFHYNQAIAYKREGKAELLLASASKASRALEAWLQRFPRSKDAYEMNFLYAESLFLELRYAEAARQHEAVRDSTMSVARLELAAENAFFAWDQHLKKEQKEGRHPTLKALNSRERPDDQKVQATPLSEIEAHLVAASDAYVSRLPRAEKAPGFAYRAAELYYAHDDFPEARRRFEAIVQTWPGSKAAVEATTMLVETYLVVKDWAKVEEVSGRLAENSATVKPGSDQYKELLKLKLGGRFNLADQLRNEGRYEEAAAKYLQLVEEAPKHEFADLALNNAALCYQNSNRFESALKFYERLYREYPTSTLADGALFRVAFNAQQSYDFDKALEGYQKLVRDYPAAKDRENALFNTAQLLEALQRYREAAAAYQRYADAFPKTEDAPRIQLGTAKLLEKEEDWRGAIRAYEAFIRKFPSQAELVVEARRRIGDAWQKLGNARAAQQAWKEAAEEFDRRRISPDSNPLAAEHAAYCRFQLAEAEFQKFDKVKVGGSGKALERSLKAKKDSLNAAVATYDKVFTYKRLNWSLAGLYRRAYGWERLATSLIEAPIPPEVKRGGDEEVAVYQDLIAQQTVTLEDAAVERYIVAINEARKNRISNEWTRRTLEALNRFRPKEYPVLKAPLDALTTDRSYPEGLASNGTQPPVTNTASPQPSSSEPKEPAAVSGGGTP
jgi:cellulose synthase operon protein C